jgi:MFS transporter, DHA2 family, multidrug resistance protein
MAVRSAPDWSTLFYDNTQAMHVALGNDLAPYRAAAPPGLEAVNTVLTGRAAFVAVVDQFEVMTIAVLIVSRRVLRLRPANRQGV